ncbi:TPA: hypothetical protein ACG4O9_000523 [Stenotrophomonas maltophilia]
MGEAKRRGSKEFRVSHAIESGKKRQEPIGQIEYINRTKAMFDPLTTPSEIDAIVKDFCASLSDHMPVMLECQPEPWSRQQSCDGNVFRYIELNGGSALCGYIIWYTDRLYVEAERHMVWTDGSVLRDVSFVASGEKSILFLPDQLKFDERPGKVRHAVNARDAEIIHMIEAHESRVQVLRASTEESWNMMPSYEQLSRRAK